MVSANLDVCLDFKQQVLSSNFFVMIYIKDDKTLVIEIKYGYVEYLHSAIKGIIFCLRNQDGKSLGYEDMQMVLWLLEELLPSWQQIDLSKHP